jgi:hypothetical protein
MTEHRATMMMMMMMMMMERAIDGVGALSIFIARGADA